MGAGGLKDKGLTNFLLPEKGLGVGEGGVIGEGGLI